MPTSPPEPPRDCPRCPRLVEYRRENQRKEPTWYNGPAPSFGDWNADPLTMLQEERRMSALSSAILQLPAREQEVMELHYTNAMKFKDIGLKIGVSASRVCQLHRHAVELLRARLHHH